MTPWNANTTFLNLGMVVSPFGADIAGLAPQHFVASNFDESGAFGFSYVPQMPDAFSVEATFQFACAHYDGLLRRLAD